MSFDESANTNRNKEEEIPQQSAHQRIQTAEGWKRELAKKLKGRKANLKESKKT